MRRKFAAALSAALLLCACQPKAPDRAPEKAPDDAPASPAMPEAPEPPPEFRGDFDARGTEPFWAARIRADGITIMRPETPPVTALNSGPRMAGPQAVWAAWVGDEPLVVALFEHDCFDGMSDQIYPYAAEVQIGDQTLTGCAERVSR